MIQNAVVVQDLQEAQDFLLLLVKLFTHDNTFLSFF